MPTTVPPRLILASHSPRRRELLADAGYDFEVLPPDPSAEDGQRSGETPREMVVRLATAKAQSVARRVKPSGSIEPALILGADTVAECRGEILGKPADRNHARDILRQLRGQVHRVWTGICLWPIPDGTPISECDVTELSMDPLTDVQIEEYLDGGLWRGKAGAFGYQDGIDWVRILRGSPSNVVGLPLEQFADMLVRITVPPKSRLRDP